jgi:hypothetical protein
MKQDSLQKGKTFVPGPVLRREYKIVPDVTGRKHLPDARASHISRIRADGGRRLPASVTTKGEAHCRVRVDRSCVEQRDRGVFGFHQQRNFCAAEDDAFDSLRL